MHKQSMVVTIASLLLLVMSAPAWSADPRALNFDITDTDDDGEVSRQEYDHRMVEVFYSADDDRDGYLDIDELGDPDPDMLSEADEDDDGRIGLPEFLKRRGTDFMKADRNADGSLSAKEANEF